MGNARQLDATLLSGSAAIVRDWGAILDRLDVQAGSLKSGDRTFTSATWALNSNLDLFHSEFDRFFGALLCSHLTCKGSTFATAFVSTGARTGPAQRFTFGVRDGHLGVVKGRVDVCDTVCHVTT